MEQLLPQQINVRVDLSALKDALDGLGGRLTEAAYLSGARDGAFGAALVLLILYALFGSKHEQ